MPRWVATGRLAETAIHLDTCFLVRALVPGTEPDLRLRQWLREGQRLCMDSIAWTEFLCGPLKPEELVLAEQIVAVRIEYSEQDARRAAEFFNATSRRRSSLGDCMIAASAREHGAALATTNLRDFKRFEDFGLRLA